MKKSTIASLIGLAFTSPVFAVEQIDLDEVTVKANRFERKDTETTYASEIHTAKQIKASGAATLYDFLAQQTSLNIVSNFGSRATPSLNLRGYGGENGHQNVVITVDDQRLNNIDTIPQLIGAIPLANIERIEISKGSGSVIYGDGATAGTVQIYTKNKTGVTVSTSWSNYGQKNHYVNAGISEQHIDLSATLAHDSHDGFGKIDNTGHKDKSDSDTQNVKLKIKPTDYIRFIAEGTSSRNNFAFQNALSKAQFKDDPRQAGGAYLTQDFDTDQWKVGAEYDITKELKLSATHFQEDKKSIFAGGTATDYDYRSNDVSLSYQNIILSAIIGYQDFDGDRDNTFNVTTKDNKATFAQFEYHPDWISESLTLSAGGRREKVTYRYNPSFGSKLKDSENLSAWDIGANYQFTPELSMFANYNKSFQAPDIDRLFTFAGTFNGFIEPAKVKTFNIGLNHVVANNRLKVTAFQAKLDDEIYLVPVIFKNTNIDKSHKYGLEIQDYLTINSQLSAGVIYNYTRAIIDKETDAIVGTIKNKDLPGAPKHTVVANLNWKFYENAMLNLNHTWRSKSYVYNDFQNNASQKQDNYESTNIALSYQHKNINVFTSLNNIFEHENSIQIANDAIYPVDFVRTWRVGVKADF